MCYTSAALIFIYERKRLLHKIGLKRSAQMRIFTIFFAKGDQGNSGKRPRPLLNSVLTCNCHSSSLQLSPTIFLAVPFGRLPRNRATTNQVSRPLPIAIIAAKRSRGTPLGSIFCSPRCIGESLDFRDDRVRLFCIVAFFTISTFFLSRVRRV